MESTDEQSLINNYMLYKEVRDRRGYSGYLRLGALIGLVKTLS